jgi:hypothetical protein
MRAIDADAMLVEALAGELADNAGRAPVLLTR